MIEEIICQPKKIWFLDVVIREYGRSISKYSFLSLIKTFTLSLSSFVRVKGLLILTFNSLSKLFKARLLISLLVSI